MAEQPSPAPDASTLSGRVADHRRLPPGVVPRHLQQWVLIGTALVMVGILALSGPPAKPRTPTTPAAAMAVDANQQRIEEYQRRIQEQAQRLTAEQTQLEATKEALAASPGGAGGAAGRPSPGTAPASSTSAAPTSDTRDAREDRARFADNVAFSRSRTTRAVDSPTVGASVVNPPTVPPTTPPLVAPRVSAEPPSMAGVPVAPPLPGPTPTAPTPAAPTSAARVPSAPTVLGDPRYTLFEGTVIETVLVNRLDGTFSGPVNCLVSVPVYAADHLVIPAGARVLGEAHAVNTFGQSRLVVVFHRVILPTGEHVELDDAHGLNQVGDLGLRDQVDRHYAQIFGASLALGAIAGFAQGQSSLGPDATAVDAYRQGTAANVSQSSTHVLDRFLNLLPTVTIREGHRIKVYLTRDLALPAYRDPLRLTGGPS